jgi:hypothetical protein
MHVLRVRQQAHKAHRRGWHHKGELMRRDCALATALQSAVATRGGDERTMWGFHKLAHKRPGLASYVEKKKKKKTPGALEHLDRRGCCLRGCHGLWGRSVRGWEWLAEPRESSAYRVVPPIAPIQPPDQRQQMRESHPPPGHPRDNKNPNFLCLFS